MTDSDPPSGSSDDNALSREDVYKEMDPLEPYTTSELARMLGTPRRLVHPS